MAAELVSARSESAAPLLAVGDVAKRYGAVAALRGVTFAVHSGEIFGLLGPNGAGKTTALECILGLRRPDAGTITVAGIDVLSFPEKAKRLLGAQLQSTALQDKITPREALDLFASFHGAPVQVEKLLERFGLREKADAKFDTLSEGQKQRVGLALALVNDPRLIVLDEPTAGLDPRGRRELHELIGAARSEGRAVLLSTHSIDEAEQFCDRVAILDQGRIIALGSPAELIAGARAAFGLAGRAPSLEDVFLELTGREWTAGAGGAMNSSLQATLTGLCRHAVLTVKLNFRSRQAVIFGYVMPILFLVGFAGIFRSDAPPLWHEMPQLLTITILGSACLGMPTALVAERDRGVWRRYRLLPAATGMMVVSTLVARMIILTSSAALQIACARLIFGTPWPAEPLEFLAAFLCASAAFLGLGLLLTALAENVPAVQALGQCVFLPMIMIGGVGVPLGVLPPWAQRVATFLPGRYSVEALGVGYGGGDPAPSHRFSFAALLLIGLAGAVAGAKLFRWDKNKLPPFRTVRWVAVALASWAVVGMARLSWREATPAVAGGSETGSAISEAQIASISFADLPPDNDVVTPLAAGDDGFGGSARMDQFAAQLAQWPPARTTDPRQNVRNLVSLATLADLAHDPQEHDVARAVLNRLNTEFAAAELRRALAWVVLDPNEGTIITEAPELGLRGPLAPALIRERNTLYAKKFLIRTVAPSILSK